MPSPAGHFAGVCCGQPLGIELRDRAGARLPVQNTAPACLDPVRQWRHQSKTCHDNSAHLLMPLSFLDRLLPRPHTPVQVPTGRGSFASKPPLLRIGRRIGGTVPRKIAGGDRDHLGNAPGKRFRWTWPETSRAPTCSISRKTLRLGEPGKAKKYRAPQGAQSDHI